MSVVDISRGACLGLARRLPRLLELKGAAEPLVAAGHALLRALEDPVPDPRRIADLSAAFLAELEADLRGGVRVKLDRAEGAGAPSARNVSDPGTLRDGGRGATLDPPGSTPASDASGGRS
jgi:hypothetical protein